MTMIMTDQTSQVSGKITETPLFFPSFIQSLQYNFAVPYTARMESIYLLLHFRYRHMNLIWLIKWCRNNGVFTLSLGLKSFEMFLLPLNYAIAIWWKTHITQPSLECWPPTNLPMLEKAWLKSVELPRPGLHNLVYQQQIQSHISHNNK